MAANTIPIVPGSPGVYTADTIANNTSRAKITGAGTNTVLIPTTTNGVRVDRIDFIAAGNTAAALCFLWYYNGTTQILIDEFDIPAITAGNTTKAAHVSRSYSTLYVEAGHQLLVSTTIAQNTDAIAFTGKW
jgi:hypothetical protein